MSNISPMEERLRDYIDEQTRPLVQRINELQRMLALTAASAVRAETAQTVRLNRQTRAIERKQDEKRRREEAFTLAQFKLDLD